MSGKYLVYYDSGTSNSRIYILDSKGYIIYAKKKNIGSKDSAIAGSNVVLLEGLWKLYKDALQETGLKETDIKDIYASGMVTSPYGLKEIPHLTLPAAAKEFSDNLFCYYEGSCFQRNIYLIPGLKTASSDISLINNVRGEEMEMIGVMEDAGNICGCEEFALIFPGSHTHVAYIQKGRISGLLSNFTGELFHVLKAESILAPILDINVKSLNPVEVRRGVENLRKMGFNRAIYICHAMQMFQYGTAEDRFSYAEGVINGGVREALEYYCKNFWKECHTMTVVSEEFMYHLYQEIFDGSEFIERVMWIPISSYKSYAVEGLKKLLACKKECR